MAEIIQIKDGSTDVLPVSAESGSGYCKLPDGTMMVWGSVSFSASDYAKSIIPSSYTDGTVFTSVGSFVGTPDVIETTVSTVINTVNGFSIGRRPLNACNVRWIAVGRWK